MGLRNVGIGLAILFLVVLLFVVFWPEDECTRPNPVPEEYDLSKASEVLSIDKFSITGISCATGFTGTASAVVCDSDGSFYTLTGCSLGGGGGAVTTGGGGAVTTGGGAVTTGGGAVTTGGGGAVTTGGGGAVTTGGGGAVTTGGGAVTTGGGGAVTTGGGGAVTTGGGGAVTTNSTQVCSTTNCNGTNRTKKSASEISAIPSSISYSEYSDATFRSPCCKWIDLDPPLEGARPNVNYTDFLNTLSVCPIDPNDHSVTNWVNAGVNEYGGRKCGGFTINANAGPETPQNLKTGTEGTFPIKFIHDNPNRRGPSFSCPTQCACPRKDTGEYWGAQWGRATTDGQLRCNSSS
jgi:hypothetical protein